MIYWQERNFERVASTLLLGCATRVVFREGHDRSRIGRVSMQERQGRAFNG
jgi:hypothetical protein